MLQLSRQSNHGSGNHVQDAQHPNQLQIYKVTKNLIDTMNSEVILSLFPLPPPPARDKAEVNLGSLKLINKNF